MRRRREQQRVCSRERGRRRARRARRAFLPGHDVRARLRPWPACTLAPYRVYSPRGSLRL